MDNSDSEKPRSGNTPAGIAGKPPAEKIIGANSRAGELAGKSIPEKIVNGIVIDHIRAFGSIRLLEALELIPKKGEGAKTGKAAPRIFLLANVQSKKIGRKDILKIEGYSPGHDEIDKISLLCPDA